MDLDDSDIALNLVRNALNNDKVKLWLPPYNCNSSEFKALVDRYSRELNLSSPEVLRCLSQLKQKAIDNLKDKDDFQATGIASLKIRPPNKSIEPFNVKIPLTSSGEDLKKLISQHCSTSASKLKLISKGVIIKDNESLQNQSLKHGMQIMALFLGDGAEEIAGFEKNQALLDSTKSDVELLSGEFNKKGDYYLQIADQTGKPICLPRHEQKALMLAMALHEKGRVALKKSSYALALLLLLEAEKEFNQCNSKLLEMVDNYGLLSLDLAWCYLNLQSLSQLPDAQLRLQKCEQNFQKTYGTNLERLIAVKGSSGNEKTLFLRLHLLQAVVLYHQGKMKEAAKLLEKVERELNELKVDEEKLATLIELGYSEKESRLALRETRGDLEAAPCLIDMKRAEQESIREQEKKERSLNKEREKLGRCLDGNWVEPQFHQSLIGMGYSHWVAKWALAQTNNRISDAITLIQDKPESIPKPPVNNEAIDQISALGFDPRMAAAALLQNNGNLEVAIEQLTSCGGVISDVDLPELDENEAGPSNREASKSKRKEKKEKEKEAFSRISEGLSNDTEDYLDSSLTAEEEFLNIYKNLIFRSQEEKK